MRFLINANVKDRGKARPNREMNANYIKTSVQSLTVPSTSSFVWQAINLA